VTAPKIRPHDRGKNNHDCHDSECSQMPHTVVKTLPNANPALVLLRNAEGSDTNTSAVADATDKVEKRTEKCDREGDDAVKLE
jgi:hypothetical protein